MKASRLIA